MFGPSKRDKEILSTVSKTVVEQLTGIMQIQHDDYGDGIQFLIVESKFFENDWIYFYIAGWIEGYCRATRLKEKYWKKAFDLGLNEAAWFFETLYKNQRKTINWLKIFKGKKTSTNSREGLEAGMREGSEVGVEIYEFLERGIFPKSDKLVFNALGVKLRQANVLAVNMLREEARNGDRYASNLIHELNLTK